jgi:hypothetical protein
MATPSSQKIKGLFQQLYDFGDSLTSYGDFAAYLQKTVLAASAQPAWSGVSWSNANFGNQLGLRTKLGIPTPSTTPPAGLDIPSPFYQVVNPFVATPGLGTLGAPSFAIGGATSGTTSLYDILTITGLDGKTVALSSLFPKLAQTGVQNQINAALKQRIRPASNELALIQGGANDLLIAYIQEDPDIEGVLDQVMQNMRQNLSVQLRAAGSRQLMSFGLADFQGVVDGVPYQMPFLSNLLKQASQPDAPAWLQPWKSFVETGGLEEFQTEYATMLQELGREFPYSTVIYYTPEFGTNWDTYGKRLGNFDSYGINNTVDYAQATNQDLPAEATNAYLYFEAKRPAGKTGEQRAHRPGRQRPPAWQHGQRCSLGRPGPGPPQRRPRQRLAAGRPGLRSAQRWKGSRLFLLSEQRCFQPLARHDHRFQRPAGRSAGDHRSAGRQRSLRQSRLGVHRLQSLQRCTG